MRTAVIQVFQPSGSISSQSDTQSGNRSVALPNAAPDRKCSSEFCPLALSVCSSLPASLNAALPSNHPSTLWNFSSSSKPSSSCCSSLSNAAQTQHSLFASHLFLISCSSLLSQTVLTSCFSSSHLAASLALSCSFII